MLSSLLVVALSASAASGWGDDCRFRAERKLDLPAADVARLLLDTGAGDLRIVGDSQQRSIELVGKACASSQAFLDQVQLDARREGADQRVATLMPDSGSMTWHLIGSDDYAYMDLTLRVPARLALVLRDSSGDIDIQGVGPLDLTDSSGDIRVRDVFGDVRLADTSGDIDIDDVKGKVDVVSDSSGDIQLRHVKGDATVEEDSSGDIELADIEGNAGVGKDSSGDIRFSRIGGSASVGRDSSGSVVADHVRGGFKVDSKSGGQRNISYHDVTGPVSLPDDR